MATTETTSEIVSESSAQAAVISSAESTALPASVYARQQFAMKVIHITFEKGFENIISLLDKPPSDDLYNFIGYTRTWAISLLAHHQTEDEVLFPKLQEKLDFSVEVTQHEVIHDVCTKYIRASTEMQQDTSKFDPAKLKSILLEHKDVIFNHLNQEVADLDPERMKVFTEQEIADLTKAVNKQSKKSDPFTIFVYMRCHTPPEYKGFPPLPWFVRSFLVPWVFASKYSGYWKYAPYDLY
ncbi:uncharacterized protein V1516DRAFT_682152 [Lipomyces oligophaga]|uniref:uncharacterized protein n=1 Tax=Lipomyces oligophaga TaxID=45792 RepID=UPI0034D014E9